MRKKRRACIVLSKVVVPAYYQANIESWMVGFIPYKDDV